MSCSICTLPYTKRLRNRIQCNECHIEYCSTCLKRWIVENALRDPFCMNNHCRVVLDLEFLYSNLNYAFVNQKIISGVYVLQQYHIQQQLLVLDEPYIDQYKRIDDMESLILKYQLEYKKAKKQRSLAFRVFMNTWLNFQSGVDMADDLQNLMQQQISEEIQQGYIDQIGHLQNSISEMKLDIQAQRNMAIPDKIKFKCVSPSCTDGIITESRPKCFICNTIACIRCRSVFEPGHICVPEVIASVDAIKQTCQSCPKCSTLIHKIEGCDQMFCTQCNTPFLWSTNEIVSTGFFHNPHYLEFRAINPDGPSVFSQPSDETQCLENTELVQSNNYKQIKMQQQMYDKNWIVMRPGSRMSISAQFFGHEKTWHALMLCRHGMRVMTTIHKLMNRMHYYMDYKQEILHNESSIQPDYSQWRIAYLLKKISKQEFLSRIRQCQTKKRDALEKYTNNQKSIAVIMKHIINILSNETGEHDQTELQGIHTYFKTELEPRVKLLCERKQWINVGKIYRDILVVLAD